MKKWVIAIFLLNLGLHLVFISWNTANYTDSITYMKALDQVRGTYILPGYPFALVVLRKIVGDPELAGRLVSILAASFAVFPLYGLARIIYGQRTGLFAILLYTFSPLVFRWSLRIFPHSLFSLFVILSIYCIFKFIEIGQVGFLAGGIFIGGLAVLTYPTGLVLVPVAAVAALSYFIKNIFEEGRRRSWVICWLGGWLIFGFIFFSWSVFQARIQSYFNQILTLFPMEIPGPQKAWQLVFLGGVWMFLSSVLFYFIPRGGRERGWWYKRPAILLSLILAFGSYFFLVIWQKYLALSTWYQKGMQISWRSISVRWEAWLTHYLLSFPYILFYPVALFAILGIIITVIRAKKSRQLFWLVFYLYFFVGIFYALVVNKWWTPRYQYTLVPFTLIFAGSGLNWLFDLRKLRWLGIVSLSLCLGGSLVFTAFVLYWSRDTFGDIRRSAEYVRDHYLDRRVLSSERFKIGFWSKRSLVGYTWRNRHSVRPGDVVILVGWHNNVNTLFRDLSQRFETKVVHKEKSVIIPLLADDIVDWAGKNLPRRANAPVVWEQKFRKQHFETWFVELGERRGKKGELAFTSREKTGDFFQYLLTTNTEHATYFDVGVWEVLVPVEKGEKVRLEMAHARKGSEGSFWFEVYADQDADGLPDQLVAQSPPLEGAEPGQWSGWEFTAPGGKLFIGSRWKLGNWVYYARPPWPRPQLGEIMYYSRGGVPPRYTASRITNLRVLFLEREESK